MKNAVKSLIICQILILATSIIFGQSGKPDFSLSDAGKIEIFEQVWGIINEKYYDANFHGVDWQEVRERYRPQIEKTKTEEEFYALLDTMAGELNDSHTRVYSPKRRANRQNRKAAGVGLSLGKIGDFFVVTEVSPGAEAARSGIKPGMKVRSVNDLPIDQAFAQARKEVGASSSERSQRLRAFSKILSGEPGSTLKIGLIDFAKIDFEVSMTRRHLTESSPFIEKLLPSGAVYLKFDEFDEDSAGQLKKVLRKHKHAAGLILDLRGNGGGDGDAGLRVAGYFFNEQISLARLLTRTGKPPAPEIPMEMQVGAKGKRLFSKPLVILTGEKTASVAELITDALQNYHRAYVIGTQTCGCVLGFINYKEIKGGGDLSLSEFGFVTARNRRLEGAGVIPDKIVSPTIEDLRRGRDAALEAAENLLSRLAKNK